MTFASTSRRFLGAASLVSLLSLSALSAAQAVPVLSISPAAADAVVGSSVAVDVRITDVTDLYAFQFSLSFDPALLQGRAATEGSFFGAGGNTFFGGGTVDNATGRIAYVIDTLLGQSPGVSGSGSLARIVFDVVAPGTSALSFANVLFLTSAQNDISLQIENSAITAAVPEPASLLLMALGVTGWVVLRGARGRQPT